NASSGFPTQHFFGVRDYGTHYAATDGGSSYPFHESDLDSRTMTQDASGNRLLPYAVTTPATHSRGWQIPLNISGVVGERNVSTAAPLYTVGIALLTSLIPGQNQDPCQPGRSGAIIGVCAATGGPAPCTTSSASGGSGTAIVGGLVSNPPIGDPLETLTKVGGGKIIITGVTSGAGGAGNPVLFSGYTPTWRRGGWNELLNQL
ncbi:MAG TPA: hypothetical protein VFB32_09700, partial [Rudaea sp.]|nr:hypothetical protein [Rudaea sp.]